MPDNQTVMVELQRRGLPPTNENVQRMSQLMYASGMREHNPMTPDIKKKLDNAVYFDDELTKQAESAPATSVSPDSQDSYENSIESIVPVEMLDLPTATNKSTNVTPNVATVLPSAGRDKSRSGEMEEDYSEGGDTTPPNAIDNIDESMEATPQTQSPMAGIETLAKMGNPITLPMMLAQRLAQNQQGKFEPDPNRHTYVGGKQETDEQLFRRNQHRAQMKDFYGRVASQ